MFLMEAVAESRVREAEAWRDKRIEMIKSAVVEEKKRIENELTKKYENTKNSIKTRILREYRSLLLENESVRSYVALKPEKEKIFKETKKELTAIRSQKDGESGILSKFEQDHMEIMEKMRDAGFDVKNMIIMSDGIMYFKEMFLEVDEIVDVIEDSNPDVAVPMRIVKLTKNQMSLCEEGLDFVLVIEPHDLETNRYTFRRHG